MNFLQSSPINPERVRQIKQRNERERGRFVGVSDDQQFGTTPTRGRTTRARDHRVESEDAGNSSPWQRIGSPSSPSSASEFESIQQAHLQSADSDVEIVLNPTSQPLSPRATSTSSSEYARSMSRRGRERSVEEEQELGRGVEGDDEDSSAFEDAGDNGRGRGRTRERRRDPELKRSMLEDALRSSLSTILSLAPAHTGMSQTPQMSQVSLANLLSTPRSAFTSAPHGSSSAPSYSAPRSSFPPTHRPSPFASSLAARFEDEEEEEEEDVEFLSSTRGTPQDDVLSTSSDDEDNQTELSPHTTTGSRAIPIPSRSRYRSSSTSRDDAFFSPLQPSRPLGVPSSDSPPVYSRRRGGRRGRGTTRGRGMGSSMVGGSGGGGTNNNSMSPQPGPASLEERRRARMLAAQSGWTQGERAGTTDVEDETVQPDEAFAELLSAARFFSDLSPRASHTRSLPTSFDSTRTTRPPPSLPSFHSASTPALRFGRDGVETEEEEDPALASESVPTLGELSSGAEGSRSPSSEQQGSPDSKKRQLEKQAAESESSPDGQRKKGWFSWLTGKTVELKVWHLVGLCGVLVGVGWGASTLIRSYVLPNIPSFVGSTAATSNYTSRFEFAPLPTASIERASPPMSSLFL
ncbi:uncharacterized protein JCM6883_007411 [Sporobolomyces salmoneus]|uniref:uncharacterized protein n=1 Tax=Sporobolomyces salmoneus TaxID=183962 RepID=UPI0031727EE0